jgi:hypothetical protein
MSEQPPAAKTGQPATRRRASPRAPGQRVACGWCGQDVTVPARGRVPKWCSPTCRHRAWEQSRAAASGLAAVQVKDRTIETVTTVTVVLHHTKEVPVPWRPTSVPDFVDILTDLTARVDSGRVYDRDIPTLVAAVRSTVEALSRREKTTGRPLW